MATHRREFGGSGSLTEGVQAPCAKGLQTQGGCRCPDAAQVSRDIARGLTHNRRGFALLITIEMIA